MASVTFAADESLKAGMDRFPWVNWSEVARERLREREKAAELLLKTMHSKEERELVAWSVELGRKAKKDSFRRLFSQLSHEKRKELLNEMPPEKRKEYQ